jgi:hypothetical protein
MVLLSSRLKAGSRTSAEMMKEDRKDERVKKQAVEQSKLISQRKGDRGELPEDQTDMLI